MKRRQIIYTFNVMEFSNLFFQPNNKHKKTHLPKAKSMDFIHSVQLTPKEVKILLANSSNNKNLYQITSTKQQLLVNKKLFDPIKYFGNSYFETIQESFKFHQSKLSEMFLFCDQSTDRKTPVKIHLKGSLSKQDTSPISRGKGSGIDNSKRIVGKSPKSYVRQNKENYMRLNLNNMQKMRVKLKLNKK